MNEDEQEQDNIQVVNEEEHEEQEQDEGCSGITKKRRRFTLQEKLMYLQVIHQKVDKGRKSTSDMKCATCALTVTVSGKMITPLFVFKGKN